MELQKIIALTRSSLPAAPWKPHSRGQGARRRNYLVRVESSHKVKGIDAIEGNIRGSTVE
jgi:hypothetical protein